MLKRLKNCSKQEMIVLLVSFAAMFAITPFISYRYLNNDFTFMFIDLFMLSVFLFAGTHTFFTCRAKISIALLIGSTIVSLSVGFYLYGAPYTPWSTPFIVALFFAINPLLALRLTVFLLVVWAIVLKPHLSNFDWATFLVTNLVTAIFSYGFAKTTSSQNEKLQMLSLKDPLTNLFNRRAFDEDLNKVEGTIRNGQQTCLLLFDIDYFKRINDQYGHQIGDRVLVQLAELVSKRVRKFDRLYRIGGEEFAVLLKAAKANDALKMAENTRELVKQTLFADEHRITISLGVSEYRENEPKDNWFERCDAALYSAKDNGRDQSKLV